MKKKTTPALPPVPVWNAVAGYVDRVRPLREKVVEELREELGVQEPSILSIRFAPGLIQEDAELGRIWMVYPSLVTLNERPAIVLDFEHTESALVREGDLAGYQTVPGFAEALDSVKNLQ